MSEANYKGLLDHMTFIHKSELLVTTSSGDAFRSFAPPEPFSIKGRMLDVHEMVFDLELCVFREGAAQALIEIITQDFTWRDECAHFALSATARKPRTSDEQEKAKNGSGYRKLFGVMSYEFVCGGRNHGCPSAMTVGITHLGAKV
jgi:hypothetical protein